MITNYLIEFEWFRPALFIFNMKNPTRESILFKSGSNTNSWQTRPEYKIKLNSKKYPQPQTSSILCLSYIPNRLNSD